MSHVENPYKEAQQRGLYELFKAQRYIKSTNGLCAPTSFVPPAAAACEARYRARKIFEAKKKLLFYVDRHANLLEKRWVAISNSAKIKILKDAFPEISETHRPDCKAHYAFIKSGKSVDDLNFQTAAAYLWPHINLEDLCEGKSLLLFMESRARYQPRLFAHRDYEDTYLGRLSGALNPALVSRSLMLLTGDTWESYGTVIPGEDEYVNQQGKFAAGAGLIVLEVQKRIVEFLLKCCFAILRPVSHESFTHTLLSIQATSLNTRFESFAITTPYRVPARLDFGRVMPTIASTRLDAEEHVWQLREDPGYFSHMVMEVSEHRYENIRDIKGKLHSCYGSPLFWDRVIFQVISEAYGNLAFWNSIYQQVIKLARLQRKYSKAINEQYALPTEYMEALASFKLLVIEASRRSFGALGFAFRSSPRLRSHWVRQDTLSGFELLVKGDWRSDPLLFVIESISRCLGESDEVDLVDELERTIRTSKEQKERLSSWVAGTLNECAILANLEKDLDQYHPWVQSMRAYGGRNANRIAKEFDLSVGIVIKVLEESAEGLPLYKLGTPLKKRFHYPCGKLRTKGNVELMRIAEQNLDAFWDSVDGHYRKMLGQTLSEKFKHLFIKRREIERTPIWEDPSKKDPKKSEMPRTGTVEPAMPVLARKDRNRSPVKRSGRSFVPTETTEKVKTRGVAIPPTLATTSTIAQVPSASATKPKFILPSKHYLVFRTIFFVPNLSSEPGELPWSKFVAAMIFIGFQAELTYGSVWHFQPTEKLNLKKSVHIHGPHPSSKTDYILVRKIGKKLTETYQWTGETFEEA